MNHLHLYILIIYFFYDNLPDDYKFDIKFSFINIYKLVNSLYEKLNPRKLKFDWSKSF